MGEAAAAAGAAGLGAVGNYLGAAEQARSAEHAANKQLEATREQVAAEKEMFGKNLDFQKQNREQLLRAYNRYRMQGQLQMGSAEDQFMDESSKASPGIQQMKEDAYSATSRNVGDASREMQANLSLAGVRGGQAATQLRRGVEGLRSQAQRDVNTLESQEALQREAERRAYLTAKAGRAQSGALGAVTL